MVSTPNDEDEVCDFLFPKMCVSLVLQQTCLNVEIWSEKDFFLLNMLLVLLSIVSCYLMCILRVSFLKFLVSVVVDVQQDVFG